MAVETLYRDGNRGNSAAPEPPVVRKGIGLSVHQ